ncbi:MAG TPA: thiamine pyrophosphate-dependent enzyme [Jatrophihabitans sp.]|jgi:thiamine pyrophosphate-dependent acetolactate synthase large subunit-like protein|nr:thiamine pyrophosphate-dependent enzyme [Jatrophihabitans sp.]
MRRVECLEALAPLITDQLVVTNVARTAFEWNMVHPREGNLYTMGMGLVTPVALGLALSLPHRGIVALDGDGSILLNLGALATVGNCAPGNLVSVVFDNEAYASTGGLPTATSGRTDLVAIAKGAGIDNAVEVTTPAAFAAAAAHGLAAGNGPCVIVAKVASEIPKVEPKLMDGRENKYRFVRYIESTEDCVILKPSCVGREGL